MCLGIGTKLYNLVLALINFFFLVIGPYIFSKEMEVIGLSYELKIGFFPFLFIGGLCTVLALLRLFMDDKSRRYRAVGTTGTFLVSLYFFLAWEYLVIEAVWEILRGVFLVIWVSFLLLAIAKLVRVFKS